MTTETWIILFRHTPQDRKGLMGHGPWDISKEEQTYIMCAFNTIVIPTYGDGPILQTRDTWASQGQAKKNMTI